MNKVRWLLLYLPTCLLSSCAVGPLVEVKLAEEGAKFVDREVEVTRNNPTMQPIKNHEAV